MSGQGPDYLRDEESYLAHVRALQSELWPSGVPREPVFPLGRKPLTEYLRDWAGRQPDKPAVLFYGRATTYGELDRLSDRFAAMLARLGARKGDRVAVFLPNCPQFYICFFGILKAGCVHVPVNPMFTRPELTYELNDTGARIVVAHDQLAHLVGEVRAECGVEHLIVTSFLDALPDEPEGPLPAALTTPRVAIPNSIDMMDALTQEIGAPPAVDVSLDDIAALNYTGGTTGMPKGCVHTQFDMLFTGAVMGSISMSVTREDVIINFWPIFWMAGEDVGIILPIVTGATCVLLARWDPAAFMFAVERNRATISNMVVDNAVEIMNHPDAGKYDLSSLREVMVASFVKKLNPAFREGWRKLTGTVLREAAWGMTETHSYDAFNRGWQDDDRDLKQRQIFCGLPVPQTDFKIMEFELEQDHAAWRRRRIMRAHALAAEGLLEHAGCGRRRARRRLAAHRRYRHDFRDRHNPFSRKAQGNAQGEGHERLPFGDRIRAGPACGGDRQRRDRPRGRGARTGSRRLRHRPAGAKSGDDRSGARSVLPRATSSLQDSGNPDRRVLADDRHRQGQEGRTRQALRLRRVRPPLGGRSAFSS